jgi:hypothetical protein
MESERPEQSTELDPFLQPSSVVWITFLSDPNFTYTSPSKRHGFVRENGEIITMNFCFVFRK